MRPELEKLGATADIQTYGHIDSKLLLGAALSPKGDEFCRAVPTTRWLLSTRGGVHGEFPPGYVDRLWLTSADYVFALHERAPR